MSATILVTGGAGFIGGNLVHYTLRHTPYRVINLDALTYAGNLDTLRALEGNSRHVFVQGSIGNRALVARLLEEHAPVAVINLAAETHVDRSIDGPASFVDTNVVGTHDLLRAVLAYWTGLPRDRQESFRFVQVSTDEVYGSIDEGTFNESSPYRPNSPYAASKAGADLLVLAYHRTYGLPALVTNCTNNYGAFQFPEKLIPLMVLSAMHDRPLPVYGDGLNTREWLHVDDHCSALHRVLARGRVGETYIVGSGHEMTNIDLVRQLCALLDEMLPRPDGLRYDTLISYVADRPGHDRRYAVDASRLRDELGWVPDVSLADGLRQTVSWYLQNRAWWERVWADRYDGHRLGLGVAK